MPEVNTGAIELLGLLEIFNAVSGIIIEMLYFGR